MLDIILFNYPRIRDLEKSLFLKGGKKTTKVARVMVKHSFKEKKNGDEISFKSRDCLLTNSSLLSNNDIFLQTWYKKL